MLRKGLRPEDAYRSERRLIERFCEIVGTMEGPDSCSELPEVFKKKKLCSYLLTPRLSEKAPLLAALGNRFTLVYDLPRMSDEMHVYAILPKKPESFSKEFKVTPGLPTVCGYVVMFKPSNHWAREEFVLSDFPGIASSLPRGAQLVFTVVHDPWLEGYLHKKTASAAKKKSSPLIDKIKSRINLAGIAVFGTEKEVAEEAAKIVKENFPGAKPGKVKFVLKNRDDYYELLVPRVISPAKRISKALFQRFAIVTDESLQKCVLFPDPAAHKTDFLRDSALPKVIAKKTGFRFGTVNGEEFRFSIEDFYRHAYIVGQTGSGKTNLLKLIAKCLTESHSTGEQAGFAVFVIDPHGNLAEELATSLSDCIYLHPTKSPFGLNPLDLPPFENRDQAVAMTLDVLMNLFTNVFHLPETAINVRYILQTVTRQMYRVNTQPTLAGIYRAVMAIYNGADVGISDEQFKEHEKLLRNMPDQSFISTLGRLQTFAEDPLMRKITSQTTINIEKFIEEGKTVLFSIPQSEIGITGSTLLCSSLLLNIYYTVLARYRKGCRDHVFVIVDEFQTLQSLPILANILSEARKFGLHLIVAHQYAEQLTEDVFQAAMNNSGIKFLFQVTGDVARFRAVDPAFSEELTKTLTALPIGQCVVKLSTTPEDAKMPPFVLKVDLYPEKKRRSLEEICTKNFAPPEVDLTVETINPLFKFIDIPFPPKQRILLSLYRSGGRASIGELMKDVPHLTEQGFNRVLYALASEGYITIIRTRSGRTVQMTDKFFEDFFKVAPSVEGKELVKAAVLYYANSYYVAPVKNVPIPRPDLIVIPYKGYNLDYSSAIEVEIEATTTEKLESHLEVTFSKQTPCRERHVWCTEKDADTIMKYAEKSNKPTKIYVLTPDGVRELLPKSAMKEVVVQESKPEEIQEATEEFEKAEKVEGAEIQPLEKMPLEESTEGVQEQTIESLPASPLEGEGERIPEQKEDITDKLLDLLSSLDSSLTAKVMKVILESYKDDREETIEMLDVFVRRANYVAQLETLPPSLIRKMLRIIDANESRADKFVEMVKKLSSREDVENFLNVYHDIVFSQNQKTNKTNSTKLEKQSEPEKGEPNSAPIQTESKQKKGEQGKKKAFKDIVLPDLSWATLEIGGRIVAIEQEHQGALKRALELLRVSGGEMKLLNTKTRKECDFKTAPPGNYTLVIQTSSGISEFMIRL